MPAPAYGTPTDLPELFAVLKTKIVAVTGMQAHLVFLTLLDDEDIAKTAPGNSFVTMRLGKFVGIRSHVAGGGILAYEGTISVQLWHRQDNDQHARAADYLLGDGGVLAKWLPLLGGLELYSPLRVLDTTKCLLIEPMRNNPGFEVPARRPPGWGRLDSAWSVKLVHRLT